MGSRMEARVSLKSRGQRGSGPPPKLYVILRRMDRYSKELGLDLKKPEDRFKWFLASILFAKRISADVAKRTYRMFEQEGLVTPEKILNSGWNRLVEVLDSGGYVRYDFSTASNLLSNMKLLKNRYGSLEEIHRQSSSSGDLERRLREFKGVGPVAVNIFLRELRGIWEKARPKPSKMSMEVARKMGLKEVECYESVLVRIKIEYCKRGACQVCPVGSYCRGIKRSRR